MNFNPLNTNNTLPGWQINYADQVNEKLEIPDEFDFLKAFHGEFWPTAKQYYEQRKP